MPGSLLYLAVGPLLPKVFIVQSGVWPDTGNVTTDHGHCMPRSCPDHRKYFLYCTSATKQYKVIDTPTQIYYYRMQYLMTWQVICPQYPALCRYPFTIWVGIWCCRSMFPMWLIWSIPCLLSLWHTLRALRAPHNRNHSWLLRSKHSDHSPSWSGDLRNLLDMNLCHRQKRKC